MMALWVMNGSGSSKLIASVVPQRADETAAPHGDGSFTTKEDGRSSLASQPRSLQRDDHLQICSHAIDRSPADAVDFGKMACGLAVSQALAGLGTLHVVEPALAAHLHTVFKGDDAVRRLANSARSLSLSMVGRQKIG
jgi:hypothetical protein